MSLEVKFSAWVIDDCFGNPSEAELFLSRRNTNQKGLQKNIFESERHYCL